MDVPSALREAGVTAREAEVLAALGGRLTNAEIAERLYISVRTVESHVSALLRKLGAPDRRALAERARAVPSGPAVQLPHSLVGATGGEALVGRTFELDRIGAAEDLVRALDVRRALLIAGDSGIGKSRLATEAAVRAHARGAVVVHGRCQQDTLIPYQAFIEAVTPLSLDARSVLRRPAGQLGEGPSSVRYRLFEEFDRVLASQPVPVVFVLDDVQWLDPSGRQLLHHLLRHVDRSPMMILATGRPEAVEPRHPLAPVVAATEAAGTLEIIHLRGLTLDEARALAISIPAADPAHVARAWEWTAGNPFLLSEVLRSGEAPTGLPTTARDAIARRLAGLGPSVFDTLTAAAVVGEVFHLDLLIAALGGNGEEHAGALERAFGAGVVTEDPGRSGAYRFRHAIVRDALIGVASPTLRCRLHLALAVALEASGSGAVAEIARHRHAALPEGDPARAHRAALAAADDAMERLAYEVAASFADMALDAIEAGGGSEVDRADALLHRGRAHIRAGDLVRGTADCRLALELASRHRLQPVTAAAVLGWADAAAVWGRQPELRAAIEATLASGVEDLATRAQLEAKLAQVLYYEDAGARRAQLGRDAVEHARRSGRPDVLAAVLAATHAALWDPAHLHQRTEAARSIVATAAGAGHPELEAHGLGWLAVELLEAGDVSGADEAFARHATLAERLHLRLALRDAELWAAMRATLAGRLDEAGHHVERARELGRVAGDPSAETIHLVQCYWLALERGDRSEMEALVEPCERIVAASADVPAWRAALALLHARRDDEEAARREYEVLAEDDFRSIPDDVVWLNAMTYLAETCALLGDAARAPLLSSILEPYADRVALIDRALACKGSVHRFLGLLAATAGDTTGAIDHLGRALQRHEVMGADLLAERTRRELGGLRPHVP